MDKEQAIINGIGRIKEYSKEEFQRKVDDLIFEICDISKNLNRKKRELKNLQYEEPDFSAVID